MDISEIKLLKAAAEADIKAALLTLEQATGLSVDTVTVMMPLAIVGGHWRRAIEDVSIELAI